MNEEMYEEEDDDLPAQYRRLTAHLQTQNAQFDRRWQAYLVNQVAMRSALGPMGAPQNEEQMNPLLASDSFMNPAMVQAQLAGLRNQGNSPQMFHQSPTNYRSSPYPINNNNQDSRQNSHDRSASISVPQSATEDSKPNFDSSKDGKTEDRRMSMPAQSRPDLKRSAPSGQPSPNQPRKQSSHRFSSENYSNQEMPSPFTYGSPFSQAANSSQTPFSLSLPMESQQILADAPLDMSNPMMAAMMSEQQPSGSSSYNQHIKSENSNSSHPYKGLDQTITPSQLAGNKAHAMDADWNQSFAPQMPNETSFTQNLFGSPKNHNYASQTGTPMDDGSWTAFIDGDMFGSQEQPADA